MSMQANKFWLWGHVMQQVPGPMRAMYGQTACSVETGARALGCDNILWMDSLDTLDEPGEERYQYLKEFKQIICGLTHIETNGPGRGGWDVRYAESARNIGRFSRTHKNVTGVILDDFLHHTGPSKDMTVAELAQVYNNLKEENPEAKLYIVAYLKTQQPERLLPYKDFFDGASVWLWDSSDYFWNNFYDREIGHFKELFPDKELLQGQFIHDFLHDRPQPTEQIEIQCEHIIRQLDQGNLAGWILLHTGYLDQLTHRRQFQLIKEYWDWYRQTRTVR